MEATSFIEYCRNICLKARFIKWRENLEFIKLFVEKLGLFCLLQEGEWFCSVRDETSTVVKDINARNAK